MNTEDKIVPAAPSEQAEPMPSSRLADLKAIDRAMQHMGDVLNNMDAVEGGDEQLCAPGFEAIDRLLAATLAALLPAQPEQIQPQQSGSIRPSAEPAGQQGDTLSGWISVEDSVPGLDVPVWLYEPDRGVWVGGRSDGGDGWLWCNCCGTQFMRNSAWEAQEFDMDDDYMPTHWMPLPAVPEASPASRMGGITSKESAETAAPGASTEDKQ